MLQTVSAKAGELVWRRKELVGAGIVFVVAVSLATRAAGTPWMFGPSVNMHVGANVLVGASLLAAALLARRFAGVGRWLALLAGLVALMAGLMLVWLLLVSALAGSGPALDWARVAIAAAGDVATSGLALAATGMVWWFGPLRRVSQDVRTHWVGAVFFLALWLALLVFSGGTPVLLLPILASLLVGWWRNLPAARHDESHLVHTYFDSILVGGFVMLVHMLQVASLDAISTLRSGAAAPFGVEGVAFFDMFVIIGFMQGAVGGLLGAGLAAIWRHWHGRGGPVAPAGAP